MVMKAGPLLIVAVTVGLVAAIAPHLSGESVSPAGESASESPDGGQTRLVGGEAKQQAWLSGETVLERYPDGHFYADVSVGGRSGHFLVDTGASMVALTGEDASAMGLVWDDSEIVPIGRGASGVVNGVPVSLDHVELGGITADNVEAAIVPEGLGISLLGQSFLSQVGQVRIDGDRMILGS